MNDAEIAPRIGTWFESLLHRLRTEPWGTVGAGGPEWDPGVAGPLGQHGVEYGKSPTWEGPAKDYVIIGWTLPEHVYVEIEDGDWADVNGFRIWRDDLDG